MDMSENNSRLQFWTEPTNNIATVFTQGSLHSSDLSHYSIYMHKNQDRSPFIKGGERFSLYVFTNFKSV